MWLLDKFLKKAIRTGKLVVTDYNGKVYEYGPGVGEVSGIAELRIRLTDRKAARHIATYPQDIVFRCADDFNGNPYYESVDLVDAFHPQTIVAHALNGEPLPVRNGAPLRVRIERQLGYKSAKYLTGIEAVASLEEIEGGKGGYWEDRGYHWYAGA